MKTNNDDVIHQSEFILWWNCKPPDVLEMTVGEIVARSIDYNHQRIDIY